MKARKWLVDFITEADGEVKNMTLVVEEDTAFNVVDEAEIELDCRYKGKYYITNVSLALPENNREDGEIFEDPLGSDETDKEIAHEMGWI